MILDHLINLKHSKNNKKKLNNGNINGNRNKFKLIELFYYESIINSN